MQGATEPVQVNPVAGTVEREERNKSKIHLCCSKKTDARGRSYCRPCSPPAGVGAGSHAGIDGNSAGKSSGKSWRKRREKEE